MNSKRKGSDGERELAQFLREHGYSGRRGQQYSGANGDADVEGLPGIHIECKRVEKLNIDEAMEQSIRDTFADSLKQGITIIPTVFHRRNRKQWKVTMLAEDFLKIYENGGRPDGQK